MKLPKTIKIGPATYGIDALPDHDENLGHCTNAQLMIRYNKVQSDQSLKHTLVHESLHGMFYVFGIRNHVNNAQQEEALVSSLEPALILWMRDNPALVKMIMEK